MDTSRFHTWLAERIFISLCSSPTTAVIDHSISKGNGQNYFIVEIGYRKLRLLDVAISKGVLVAMETFHDVHTNE